jgi:hypothetical protein
MQVFKNNRYKLDRMFEKYRQQLGNSKEDREARTLNFGHANKSKDFMGKRKGYSRNLQEY